MNRYWISWIQRTEDYRPLTSPPNVAILGWWCSGFDGDDNAVICATVQAIDPSAAALAVFSDWPEAEVEVAKNGWRFFEPREPGWIPSDRFALSEWERERFAAATN